MTTPTRGEQIEAKRLGCEPHELGGANLADAHAIDAAIAEAVKGEREACANVCEANQPVSRVHSLTGMSVMVAELETADDENGIGKVYAAAIRARGNA